MTLKTLLKTLKGHPLIHPNVSKKQYVHLDLSLDNQDLQKVDLGSPHDLERFIWNYMRNQKARIAYGGYLETRGIYKRSSYFNREDSEAERNIHLGIDLWSEVDTPIYAPLQGKIHSFRNNTNFGDYGPTIILEHAINDAIFYTLYGHLSLASISDKHIGMAVKKGDAIATLGPIEINGNYPPHLHFQIIKDVQHHVGDYPGVCSRLDLNFYKMNCPDPKLLFDLN